MNIRHLALAALAASTMALLPSAALALPARNVPSGVAQATYIGRVDSASEMNLTVVLKLHDQAAYDRAVDDLYDPASPSFHHWFTDADFLRYAPTPAEYALVRGEFESRGFRVLTADPLRMTLRVHGAAAQVEAAFHTQLHILEYQGRRFQSHTLDARLDGPAADLIDSVSGIERHASRPQFSTVRNPKTGLPVPGRLLATPASLVTFAASLTPPPPAAATRTFTTGTDIGKFTGFLYAANGKTPALTPKNIQAHYGIPFTQNKTVYNGAGQTIALVEAYGYANAEADANQAAALFGLPTLTAANFSVIYPEGPPLKANAGELTGWSAEIALDIQSAHAIAPGAKILVVASAAQDNEDQIASLNYITVHKLATAVSSSWENDAEIIAGPLEEQAFNAVLKAGAASGISFQFSSGDSGDLGLGSPVGDTTLVLSFGTDASLITATGWDHVTGWGEPIGIAFVQGVTGKTTGAMRMQHFDRPGAEAGLQH